jgi:hypothetical protein
MIRADVLVIAKLNVITLHCFIMAKCCYNECHYAERDFPQWHYDQSRYFECHYAESHSARHCKTECDDTILFYNNRMLLC